MKAAYYEEFGGQITIRELPDPVLSGEAVLIQVKATGLCLSDWHGWMGHDPDITLPHVPGHELAGVIEAVGSRVTRWKAGDRVTLPFVCACGRCPQCASGNQQVCDDQFQPGFTHWGSFAELVAIDRADTNLVALPDDMDFISAASLGCRFATSFRAIVDQGRVSAGQWVAVYGCGGVGLAAVMIAQASGAHVVAVDIQDGQLELARSVGAVVTINAAREQNVVRRVRDVSRGGVHVSMDALGSAETCFNSIASLRKRGVHLQAGLTLADHRHPAVPMDRVIAHELEILGCHGMQAFRYPAMLEMIRAGRLAPEKLIGRTISLEQVVEHLPAMGRFRGHGITVIDSF
jgi:alcohol dehydrogenase